MVRGYIKKMRVHHHGLWILAVALIAASVLPGGGEDPAVRTILTFVGTLFGLITGFSLTDLWKRFQRMRELVAKETSSLTNYFFLAKLLGNWPQNKAWAEKQVELIDRYLLAWIPAEWHEYHKADLQWKAIRDSIFELKDKVEKGMQGQVFSRLLHSVMVTNEAREELNVLGKNKLSLGLWSVLLSLAGVFLFTLFYLKSADLPSVLFTAILATVVIVLLLAMRDLNNLRFGEEIVSFEPYERVLDAIGKPRFYPRAAVEEGRIKRVPEGARLS